MTPSTVQLLAGNARFVLASTVKLAAARFVKLNVNTPLLNHDTPVSTDGLLAMTEAVTVNVTALTLNKLEGSEALTAKLYEDLML